MQKQVACDFLVEVNQACGAPAVVESLREVFLLGAGLHEFTLRYCERHRERAAGPCAIARIVAVRPVSASPAWRFRGLP